MLQQSDELPSAAELVTRVAASNVLLLKRDLTRQKPRAAPTTAAHIKSRSSTTSLEDCDASYERGLQSETACSAITWQCKPDLMSGRYLSCSSSEHLPNTNAHAAARGLSVKSSAGSS